jgi:hypothetical protein
MFAKLPKGLKRTLKETTINLASLLPDGHIKCSNCLYCEPFLEHEKDKIYPDIYLSCSQPHLTKFPAHVLITKEHYTKCLLLNKHSSFFK